MKLEFFPAAQQEFEEAPGWYESRMPGLGAEFAEEVERISGRLLELHSLGEKLDQIHRRISLRRAVSELRKIDMNLRRSLPTKSS